MNGNTCLFERGNVEVSGADIAESVMVGRAMNSDGCLFAQQRESAEWISPKTAWSGLSDE